MKVEIEREVYEKLKGSAVKLDMECKYYIVIPSVDELPKPRKKTGKGNASPLDIVGLSKDWNKKVMPSTRSRAARLEVVRILNEDISEYMARGELAEKLHAVMGGARNTSSGRVSRLIRLGVLEVRK